MICRECGVNEVEEDLIEEEVCLNCYIEIDRDYHLPMSELDFGQEGRKHRFRDYYEDSVEEFDDDDIEDGDDPL